MHTRTTAMTANNLSEARDRVSEFIRQGYDRDHIYVLAHDDESTERAADISHAETIGMKEEGAMTAIANMFRSKGDKLRAKIESLDVSPVEASRLEKEMDRGKIVVLACSSEGTPPTTLY